jgi:hypothetical protein
VSQWLRRHGLPCDWQSGELVKAALLCLSWDMAAPGVVSVATRNKDLRQSESPTSQVELLKNNDLRRAEVAGEVECPPKMSQRKQERSVTERVADAWKNKRTEKCFTQ